MRSHCEVEPLAVEQALINQLVRDGCEFKDHARLLTHWKSYDEFGTLVGTSQEKPVKHYLCVAI